MGDSVFFDSLKVSCIKHMSESRERVVQCVESLNEEQLWHKYNSSTNSVGNLVLHLNGNITQYILSSLGQEADSRRRVEEFKVENKIPKETLLHNHFEIITKAIKTISELKEGDLFNKRSVQGFNLNGIEILIHVTEHYSYHTGQIALITKQVLNKDLEFYKDMNLNALNKK